MDNLYFEDFEENEEFTEENEFFSEEEDSYPSAEEYNRIHRQKYDYF